VREEILGPVISIPPYGTDDVERTLRISARVNTNDGDQWSRPSAVGRNG
jgi:hypothetical protein